MTLQRCDDLLKGGCVGELWYEVTYSTVPETKRHAIRYQCEITIQLTVEGKLGVAYRNKLWNPPIGVVANPVRAAAGEVPERAAALSGMSERLT